MDKNTINSDFLKFLNFRNKFQNKSIADDVLIKLINKDNPLEIRMEKPYRKYMNILLDNMDHMYKKSDLLGLFNDFDVEDLIKVFDTIKDKALFIQSFLVFTDPTNIYTLDIKFQSVVDFYTIVLNKEMLETTIVKLSAELNEILDTHKNDIVKRVLNLDELINAINKIIYTSKAEKNAYGEVFTALALINMMLDTLPVEVWKNPRLKWLDPANGYGNFPVVIVQRLMIGLEDVIIPETNLKDPELRFRWIMKNMIYVCDINIKNMKIYLELFDREHKMNLEMNYFRGSFLDKKRFDSKMVEWGVSEFDVIVGNFPYNKDGVGKGGGIYWKEFVFKSFEILKNDGFLTTIHPLGWRKPKGFRPSAGDVWNMYKKYNLLFVMISDEKIKNFPSVDYYTIQKSRNQKDTRVINIYNGNKTDEIINLYDLPFIPHLINKSIISFLHKLFNLSGDKFDIDYTQTFKPVKSDMSKNGFPHTYFFKDDTYLFVFKEYVDLPPYVNENKIVLTYSNGNRKSMLYPIYYNTPIASSRNTMYYLTKKCDDVDLLLNFFKSDIVKFLLEITQFTDSPNHKNEFKILNMITKPEYFDFYDFYKIDEQLKNYILNKLKIVK